MLDLQHGCPQQCLQAGKAAECRMWSRTGRGQLPGASAICLKVFPGTPRQGPCTNLPWQVQMLKGTALVALGWGRGPALQVVVCLCCILSSCAAASTKTGPSHCWAPTGVESSKSSLPAAQRGIPAPEGSSAGQGTGRMLQGYGYATCSDKWAKNVYPVEFLPCTPLFVAKGISSNQNGKWAGGKAWDEASGHLGSASVRVCP